MAGRVGWRVSDQPFRPVNQRRAFEEILDQFEQAIVVGTLSPGDRLPSERDLATQFAVSRTSVREALRVLEALGIVSVKSGAENGVTLLREPGNALTYLLKLHLSLRHVSVENVIDFLVFLSGWGAREVALGAGCPAIVDGLDSLVDKMEARGFDQHAFHEIDAEFHSTIVRALENELVDLVLEACSDTLRRLILIGISEPPDDWTETRRTLLREHREIVAAIRERDSHTAEDLMRVHVATWSARAVSAAGARGLSL